MKKKFLDLGKQPLANSFLHNISKKSLKREYFYNLSVGFDKKLQNWMLSGKKRLVFMVGGPYGVSDEIYKRANEQLSLSKMTFSHKMVRLFFAEQLYRAYTILRNEPYHHE